MYNSISGNIGLIFKPCYIKIFYRLKNSAPADLYLRLTEKIRSSIEEELQGAQDDPLHLAKRRLHIFKCGSLETGNLLAGQRQSRSTKRFRPNGEKFQRCCIQSAGSNAVD